jgi:cytochrome P450
MPHEGSLVDLLVRAKNKETGQPLLPHQIVAQSNSVLVAGHDTTSFMITSALYHLSTNPGPKARMLQEIDTFGRDKEILFDDLEKFPYVEVSKVPVDICNFLCSQQ